MRYIAFDIGIKNFAFIVMHFDEETKETRQCIIVISFAIKRIP